MAIQPMPHEKGLDNTVHVLKEGYSYILNRRKKFQSDVFETHLLGQKAICMGGEAAAELFYDTSKFKRAGAAPKRVQKTLLGEKGVQTLDGKAHLHRKEMFMSLMSPQRLDQMNDMLKKHWEAAVEKWAEQEETVLYHEAQKVLFRAACEWAGVPFEEKEVAELAADLGKMIETPTEIGPAHWMGRHDRNQTEKWIENLIEQVRDKELSPPEGTALAVFSWHRDLEGNLLDTHTAAVEVLNIIRPIVAIAIYINFTALAVHEYPAAKEKLTDGDSKQLQAFVQEVRRFYPFFPFQGAIVKKDFTWQGYEFEEGTLTILDIYGTNHDPALWEYPEVFNPERFIDWKESPFSFIPQGGGDFLGGHRCAGEWLTIKVMNTCLDYLANRMEYEVPPQDLSYSLNKMPSVPHSEMILKNVRMKNE